MDFEGERAGGLRGEGENLKGFSMGSGVGVGLNQNWLSKLEYGGLRRAGMRCVFVRFRTVYYDDHEMDGAGVCMCAVYDTP